MLKTVFTLLLVPLLLPVAFARPSFPVRNPASPPPTLPYVETPPKVEGEILPTWMATLEPEDPLWSHDKAVEQLREQE